MTVQEFINKWNNRGIDFDGYYGDQCMDLMHQYHVEVLGITDGRTLAAPAAKDVYLNFENMFNRQLFDQIANTPDGIPQKGDIILWGTGIGPWGHVAVCVEADINRFKSFDQNFPTGSKCHIQEHDYTGVLGWLRAKSQPAQVPTDQQAEIEKLRKERDDNWNLYQKEKELNAKLTELLNQKDRRITELGLEVSSRDSRLSILEGQVNTLTEQANKVPGLKKLLTQAEDDRTGLRKDITKLTAENTNLRKTSYLTAPTNEVVKGLVKRLVNK